MVKNLSRTPDTPVLDRPWPTLNAPVAHFFFTSDLESRKDPYLALRSWISQIVSRHDNAFELVRQRRELNLESTATKATRTDVITVFTQLLHTIPGCTFVADGLDECTYLDNSSTSVKKFLHDVTSAVVGTTARVLFVSRDEPEIRHALMGDAPKRFAECKIMPEDVRSDTAVFARDIVNRKLPNKSDDVRSILCESMTDRCEGQFLWLKIQEDSLRAGMNKKQLQHAIEDTPTRLNDLYDYNWTRITQLKEWEKNRAFALLRWTAFSLRPLTVSEITEAVLILESEDLPLEDLPDAVDNHYINTEIVGLCGPLLEVRNDHSNHSVGQRTVHLPHFSIKEYLLYHLPIPGWILQNDQLQTSHEKVQNTILAKACLQYISLRQVWDSAPHDSASPLDLSFRGYAATAWHQHVTSGLQSDPVILGLCMRFLSRDNPNWVSWRKRFDLGDHLRYGLYTEVIPPGPLYYAIRMGLNEVAISLITQQNVNETSSLGLSPIGIACTKGFVEIVHTMVSNGANITVPDNNGWTPVHVASSNGHAEVVKLLLEVSRIDVSKPDALGRTALFFASRNGHYQVAEALLAEEGVNPDTTDWIGSTALFAAVANGHLHIAELLITSCAAVEMQAGVGQNLIWWAFRAGNPKLVQLLVEHAESGGTRISDDHINNDAISIPFDHEAPWCDACTLSIREGCRYSCSVCDWGFCLCMECYARGIRICGKGHVLMLQ
ncbi:Uncharacterized protein LW94_10021 [Fusarium fujikuroi]|nr:Uncharacterized protein LW94_10021 [Fusarium fujikuroi]